MQSTPSLFKDLAQLDLTFSGEPLTPNEMSFDDVRASRSSACALSSSVPGEYPNLVARKMSFLFPVRLDLCIYM